LHAHRKDCQKLTLINFDILYGCFSLNTSSQSLRTFVYTCWNALICSFSLLQKFSSWLLSQLHLSRLKLPTIIQTRTKGERLVVENQAFHMQVFFSDFIHLHARQYHIVQYVIVAQILVTRYIASASRYQFDLDASLNRVFQLRLDLFDLVVVRTDYLDARLGVVDLVY
jgi:hypothetical protein